MAGIAQPAHEKTAGETRNVAVDCRDLLDSGETLTGTPTVSGTGLTLSGATVNVAALTLQGATVGIGQAVQFTVAGGTAGTRYLIRVTASSSGGQTLQFDVPLKVTA